MLGGRNDHWLAVQERSGARSHAGYASTEMTIFALTDMRDSPACNAARLAASGYLCGHELEGWGEVRVTNSRNGMSAPGELGTIEIKSSALSSGHLIDREIAELNRDPDGWLRTGDSGYPSESGDLYLVERTKDLIRRSQENIAPAEIENALLQQRHIDEAAVVPVPDDFREQETGAVIVVSDRERPTPAEVFAHCRALLADYKVPRHLRFRDSLPRTPTFKVGKDQLMKEISVDGWIDRLNAEGDRVAPRPEIMSGAARERKPQ